MGEVIDLQRWSERRTARREDAHCAAGTDGGSRRARPPTPAGADPAVERLDRAVARIDSITNRVHARGGRLAPDVETELLALFGQISLGMVSEAARRAERLADVLGGVRSSGS
jgi:hypothetical protein